MMGHSNRKNQPEYVVDDNGCWIWQQPYDHGYSRIWHNGRDRRAHIVFWERENGPVSDGLELDHLCRNRRCVNPAHLEPVTRAENARRGKKAKLTWDDVHEIRRLLLHKQHKDIAAQFGVSRQCVTDIAAGRRWKEVA